MGSYDRRMYRLTHSGKEVWSVQVSEGSILASPLILPSGHLAVATLDGVVAAVAVKDGTVQWRYILGKPIFGTPLLSQGLLLVPSTDGFLICIDNEGKEQWRIATQGPVFSSPVISGAKDSKGDDQLPSSALIGDHGGSVTCFTLDGKVAWRKDVGAAVAGAPDTQGGGFAVCTTQGDVVLLNSKKMGLEMGRLKLGGEVFSSPLLVGNRLVVGCRDNYLYCLNIIPEDESDSNATNILETGQVLRGERKSPDPYSPATELAQMIQK